MAAVAGGAFYLLRQVHQLRPFLGKKDLATVVHAVFTSRMDYCNPLYVGLPLKRAQKLQMVWSAAAHMLLGKPRFHCATSFLQGLHWLPVVFQIPLKVLAITSKALNGLSPGYLRDTWEPRTGPFQWWPTGFGVPSPGRP